MSPNATWFDLLQYLKGLEEQKDPRLGDTCIVRDMKGDYFPLEFLEYEGDYIMSDGTIVLVPHEWGETLDETYDAVG